VDGRDDAHGDQRVRPTVGVAIIAYNAATTIEDVLERVPIHIEGASLEVLLSDDASADDTADVARRWRERTGLRQGNDRTQRTSVDIVRQPDNLGYGGNQVACYRWAIERGIDVVVLVHGDGQYPPELVPELVAPILAGEADATFGSRMVVRGGARQGGMPLTRRLGNRALSKAQNALTGASLSEWHSGFRAYRVSTLALVDLDAMPTGFDADTAMTLELLGRGARFAEIPIATRYAGEVSYINPWSTGLRILGRTLRHRIDARGRAGRASAR